jgi:1-deoxy-D-xylulose-5-phosphate synthase
MGCLPGMVVMAPSDEQELMDVVATAAAIDDRPSAFRYPRGEGFGLELPARGKVLELGRGRVMREGSKIAVLALGPRLYEALKAADELAARGLSTTVADARFMKPLDTDLIRQLARHHEVIITIEDNVSGGFGSAVLHYMAVSGLLDGGVKVRPMVIPDRLIDHNTPAAQSIEAGLTAKDIVATALTALGVADASGSAVRA